MDGVGVAEKGNILGLLMVMVMVMVMVRKE